MPADLARALTHAREQLGHFGTRVLYYLSVGSTNDVAKGLATGPDCEGIVVLAAEQTAGRGRRGHTWFSPPESGLYVSVVLNPAGPDGSRRRTQLLTLAAGLAIEEGIEASTGLVADLKWPNDLYIAGKKLGGILAEAVSGGRPAPEVEHVVLGYGINLSVSAYPSDIRDRATSLEAELGRPVERSLILVETLSALARRYRDLLGDRFDAILDAWRRRSPSSTGTVVNWTEPSGQRSGVTAGIDEEGALLVRAGGRLERIVAGELIWSPPCS